MIAYAFASLVLILSTISYCMYYEICRYQSRKIEYIENIKVKDLIYSIKPRNEWDADKSICIRQMWKDYLYIEQIHDIDRVLGTEFSYFFTVIITLGNIVLCTIKEFNSSEKGIGDIIAIVLRILIPIVVCGVIWIVCLRITKPYKTKTFQSIKDLKYSFEDEYLSYRAEDYIQTIIKEELDMKSKRCTRSTAVMIFLLIAVLTLATNFFSI